MDSTINTAHLFDAWLGQLWRLTGKLDAARRDAQALQAQRDASDALRERIAQYVDQQPSYAADLRAALARLEAESSRD